MGTWNENDHPRAGDGTFAPVERAESGVDLADRQVYPRLVHLPPRVHEMLSDLRSQGMRPVLVGGSVRDALLDPGIVPKDLDFEVFGGKSMGHLSKAAGRHGRVDEVGVSFGVVKMTMPGGHDIDLTLPRHDSKVGDGHRGFEVTTDPDMSFEDAAARRDFTINAISWDPQTGELIDPHDGLSDLRAGRLRAVSDAFDEDPLRVLRGAQFAARFDMELDEDTRARCERLADQYDALPDERVRSEFAKLASRSNRPSAGIAVLRDTGWSDRFPGRAGLDDPRLLERADRLPDLSPGVDRRIHLGAIMSSSMDEDTARAFLRRTIEGSKAQSAAFELGRRQPLPNDHAQARHQAHGKLSIRERTEAEMVFGNSRAQRALRIAEAAGVADRPQPDLLDGADVLSMTDRKPGPWTGTALREARDRQADGLFGDGPDAKDKAREWMRHRLRSI